MEMTVLNKNLQIIDLFIKSYIICIINQIVVKMAGEKVVPPKPEAQKKKE